MPNPCTLHVQIRQTWTVSRPPDERFYSIADLTVLWRRSPQTLYNWLWLLRKSHLRPQPEHIRVHRLRSRVGNPSPFRRELEIRADYVELIRRVFLERIITL